MSELSLVLTKFEYSVVFGFMHFKINDIKPSHTEVEKSLKNYPNQFASIDLSSSFAQTDIQSCRVTFYEMLQGSPFCKNASSRGCLPFSEILIALKSSIQSVWFLLFCFFTDLCMKFN